MKPKQGICLISVPKSGTMFLSRYLEQISGVSVVFGLEAESEPQLLAGLAGGWNPEIEAALSRESPDFRTMAKRFAQMLARNRRDLFRTDCPIILSDHGFTSFLAFLANPSVKQVREPHEVMAWALERNLAPVFLYRDVRAVANSLVHFLAAKKSFLLSMESVQVATDLVTRLYAPVLAAQTEMWLGLEHHPELLSVSYESLIADPGKWIPAICRHADLPYTADDLADAPRNYRSWTFRTTGDSWQKTFSEAQKGALNALALGLGG